MRTWTPMRTWKAVMMTVLAFALAGCGGSTSTTSTPPPEVSTSTAPSAGVTTTRPPVTTTTVPPSTTTTLPAPPTAEAAWTQLLANQSYRSWQTAPGHATPQPATGPHGETDQVFANDILHEALAGPAVSTWPVGSTIVKDVYDAGDALLVVEYMQRTPDGWYYASFEPSGEVATEGLMVGGCHGCHSRGSDSVFTFTLP